MARYENPWRPNYEAAAIAGWLVVGTVAWLTAERWQLHTAPFRYLALASLVMALTRLPGMLRTWSRRRRLKGRGLSFLLPERLIRLLHRHPDDLWLG
jgi:conjugal transfer pilus assembly protein TraD